MCKVQDCLRTQLLPCLQGFIFLSVQVTLSPLQLQKRYFLGSTLRICNLFSLLPFEKLSFNVCYVRCTSGSAADVRTACDPVLKLCWSLVGWPWVGMVPVGYLESRRSPWQEFRGENVQATFLGAQGVDVLCWLSRGPFTSPSSWGRWL